MCLLLLRREKLLEDGSGRQVAGHGLQLGQDVLWRIWLDDAAGECPIGNATCVQVAGDPKHGVNLAEIGTVAQLGGQLGAGGLIIGQAGLGESYAENIAVKVVDEVVEVAQALC